jgi:thioredoxin-like negative regulator of GroEL
MLENHVDITTIIELEDIQENKLPTIIKFSADWCNSCKTLKAPFKYAAQQYQDKINFICVDAEDGYELTDYFKVKSLPTIITIKNNFQKKYISSSIEIKEICKELLNPELLE